MPISPPRFDPVAAREAAARVGAVVVVVVVVVAGVNDPDVIT
jgi:hypothetical protein